MSRLSMFFAGLVALLSISAANAQFEVGGVTGGAPTAGVNCYGTAEGKILAYGNGWGAADCPTYQKVCELQTWPCPAENTLCTDGTFCGAGGPHVQISDPSSTNTAVASATNVAPVLNAVTCGSGIAGKAYSCQVSVTDTDVVTYSIAGAPSWMSINANTGTMSGTPTSKGTESTFTVTATDPFGATDTETVNAITIGNPVPLWNAHPVACETAAAGAQYSCAMSASDSDQHTLTYSLVNSPSWMSIDASTGVITGTPDTSTDFSNLEVRVTDGYDPVSATTFNVAIANNAPAFASFSCPTIGTIGSAYSCSPTASDADTGHTITYGLLSAPSWMSIDASTGAITGTVTNAAGSGVTVTASDTYDTTSATAFNVAVNHAPTISSVSCADGLDTAAYTCSVSASDSDSDDTLVYTIANNPSWASISSSGVITGTAQTGTTSNISVTVSDGTDSATSNTFSITIDPNTATKLADSSSVLTTSDVDDLATLGVSATITNDLKNNNNCGSAGNQSCLAAFNSQKTSTSCAAVSSSATGAQMQTYVNCVMKEHHTAVANAVTISPASNVVAGSSCSSSPDINVAAPSGCGHSQWTCSLVNSPTGWTYNSSGNYIVIPGDTNQTGTKSVTVRMSLGIYTPAYTKDVTFTQDVTAAVSNATNGKKYFTRSDFNYNAARNKCILHGGRLATKDEAISHHNPGLFAPDTSNPTLQKGNTSTYGDVSCSKTFNVGQNYTCRASGHWGRVWTNSYCFYGHSGNDCDAVSTSATKGFTCVGVSSCPSS